MEQPNTLVKIALNEVISTINGGVSPTSALKKVASDLDLNPNYVHRVGEALNVALHYNHFKKASDRSAQFEIADIPETIKSIFSGVEKTSHQKRSENFSNEASADSVFNYNRILSNPKYKKAYLEISQAGETHTSFPLSLRGAFEKSANLLKDLERSVDETQTTKVGAEIALNSQFSGLADHFKKDASYRTSFEEFESQAFSKHGKLAVPYLDLLHGASKTAEARGVHDPEYKFFNDSRELAMFDTLLKSAQTLVTAQTAEKIAEEQLQFEKSYYAEIGKLVANNGSLSKGASEDSAPEIRKKKIKSEKSAEEGDPVLLRIEKNAALKKSASGIGNMTTLFALGNLLSQSQTPQAFGKDLGERFAHSRGNDAPKHNLPLENMERQLLVQELMMTDPILSKVSPGKVAKAYEQILRLSPQVSKEKEVVRAMLRQAVATQAVAPHDADQWTKLDTDILKRKIVTENYMRGKGEAKF